jgi:hypothetical protein
LVEVKTKKSDKKSQFRNRLGFLWNSYMNSSSNNFLYFAAKYLNNEKSLLAFVSLLLLASCAKNSQKQTAHYRKY